MWCTLYSRGQIKLHNFMKTSPFAILKETGSKGSQATLYHCHLTNNSGALIGPSIPYLVG